MSLKKSILLIGLLLCFKSFAQVSYVPEISLRNSIRKEIWLELKPLTPVKQQFLLGLLFKSDAYFKEYERIVKIKGYSAYDLITVETFFNIICEEVRDDKEVTDDELDKRYNTVKRQHATTKKDTKLNNEGKQRKYDPLILKAMWLLQLAQSKKISSEAKMLLAKKLLHENNNNKNTAKEISELEKKPIHKTIINKKNNSNQIYDIILRTVTRYGLQGVYVTNEVNVLYKNGDVFTNPSEPLEVFNITRSKRTKPKKWDKWQKRTSIIYVTRSKTGKTTGWKKWFKVRPVQKGFKFSGKFYTSDSFGSAQVVNSSTVAFTSNGRFAWKTIKGGNTIWKPVYVKSKTSGTYQINNYTITLNYNNGVSESFFFGLYPKDNRHFIIGANHFAPIKN
jgi:hypothetical protein